MNILFNTGGVQTIISMLSSLSRKVETAEEILKQSSAYLDLKKVNITGIDGIVNQLSTLRARIVYEKLTIVSDKAMFEAAEKANENIFPFGIINPSNLIAGIFPPGGRSKTNNSFDMEQYKNGMRKALSYYDNAPKGYNIHKPGYPSKKDGNVTIYYDENGNEVYRDVFSDVDGNEVPEADAMKTTRYDAEGNVIFLEEYYTSSMKYDQVNDNDEMIPTTKHKATLISHINPNSNVLLVSFDGGEGTNPTDFYSEGKYNNVIVNSEGLSDDVSWIYASNTIPGKNPAYGDNEGDGGYYARVGAVAELAKESQKVVLETGNFTESELYTSVYAYSYGGYAVKEFTEQFESTNSVDDIFLIEAIASTKTVDGRVPDGLADLKRYKELGINVTCITGTDSLKISQGSAKTGKLGAEENLCEHIPNMGAGHSSVGKNSANYVTQTILEHAIDKLN